ncbi:MAG: hypothetical protein PHS59_18640, partial [Paludibacter sp.]|nr:hypothetical protein [Paludibacter sp.]
MEEHLKIYERKKNKRQGGEMMKKILFSIENVSEVTESEDPNFCNVSMDVFASGSNLHDMPVPEDVLVDCSETIYDVPIVWKYDSWTDDAGGHDPKEQICGFVGRANNPIKFKRMPDGRLMMSVLGKIWKRYSGKLMDILKRDGGKKSVSVEMEISDFDKIKSEIKAFAMKAVTIIGVTPAIPDAELTVLSFSKDRDEYYKTFESSDKKTYKIDLSKESAYMEDIAWRNEGRKLYGKMLSARNGDALADACYLIIEDGWRDSPSTKLKYPVCKWRGDTLCLAKSGLEAANSRLQAQGISDSSAIDKLKRYYKKLNLSTESFTTNFEEKEETKLEEEKVMMEAPVEEKKFEEETPKAEGEPEALAKEDEEEKEDFACKYAEASKQLEEYTAKFAEQDVKFAEQDAKFAAQEEELNNLRKYKADKEESEKNYAIEQTMAEVSEYLPK